MAGMDPLEALLLPVPEDEKMRALARTLRGRQVAADFFAGSTIPALQRIAQGEQEYIKDVAERQGVLRETLERRKQYEEENRKDREFRAEEGRLDREALLKRALASGPLVTIGGPSDPAAETYFKERGKADSKALDAVYASADTAQMLINNLDSFAEVMKGIETGSLSGVRTDLNRLAASIGLEVDPDADKLQTARAISNQLALLVRNPESGMGLPGQTSDRDITFLKESMPRIVNTQGGNATIIEVFRRLNQRSLDRAKMASEFEAREGRFNKAAFEREWNDYVNRNNLFDDLNAGSGNATGQPAMTDPYEGMSLEELEAEYQRRMNR